MAKILTYTNLLAPLARKTQEIEANTAYEVIEKLNIDVTLYEAVVSRNQVVVREDFEILEGDIVGVSLVPLGGGGGGKQIISIVAMIAIAVFAPYAVGAMMGANGAVGIGAGIAMGGLSGAVAIGANIAVMIGASMLVSSVLTPDTPSFEASTLKNIENSPTYGWDTRSNSTEQGKPVPMLYGKHRVTPPQISQYVETDGNNQYLNILYAVADGFTTFDTSSIQINGEAISNFNGVTVYTRDGSLNQSIIGIFDDVHTDVNIGKKLTAGSWAYSTTSGNSVSGVEIGLQAPRGIWYAKDDGTIGSYTVNVMVEILLNGQWTPLATSSTTTEVIRGYYYYSSGSFGGTKGYVRTDTYNQARSGTLNDDGSFLEQDFQPLPSNVRQAVDPNGIYGHQNIWEEYDTYVTSNNYAKISASSQSTLRYTYKSGKLLPDQYQIRAKFYSNPATGSRYGSDMYLSYVQETVSDDFIYPQTALIGLRVLATDQLSGNSPIVSVIASNSISNPSDVCKDILEKSGEVLSSLEEDKFEEWRVHCDEKNYTCNIYFDAIYTVRKALDLVGLLGRGNVLQYGSKWSVIVDKADELPVQGFLFTMGNIAKGSFNESFLPLQDRANKVEITYYDEDGEYEPQILEVSNANYDQVDNVNTSSITYIGCTNRDMALKYAKFRLNNNRYLTITQTFEVDTEAIVCRVGDVIKVAHDVPSIGLASGRIISADANGVVLDNDVILDAGLRYFIELRYSDTDEIIEVEVNNTEDTTSSLTFIEALDKVPEKYDVYTFGSINKTSKKMRVISLVTSSKQRSEITAIEYVEDVYNDVEQIAPEFVQDYKLTGLSLNESISYKATTVISDISATWRGVSLWYDVLIDDVFYERVYKDNVIIKDVVAPSTYKITIKDSYGDEISESVSLLGRFAPPEPATDFIVVQNDNIVRFNWTKSISGDVVKYEIRTGVTWETGFVIGTVGNVTTFEWFPDMNGTYKFMIKALDASNVYSEISSDTLMNVTNINENINVVIDYDGLDTDIPPCGDTVGLVFVVGVGYIPIVSAQYSDLVAITYDDIPLIIYDEAPTFTSCTLDTTKIGLTKIRMYASYSASASNITYLTYPSRVYSAFPFDTYETISSLTDLRFYYSISDDDITYSEFFEYTGILDESFRYIKFKYEFVGEIEGKNININDFKAILDVPDVTIDLSDISVVNTQDILFSTYGYEFYKTPFISPTNKDNISLPVIKNATKDGFTIEAYNISGTPITSIFDINIKGY